MVNTGSPCCPDVELSHAESEGVWDEEHTPIFYLQIENRKKSEKIINEWLLKFIVYFKF